MKIQNFTTSIWKEGVWYIAQCLEVDVASQGGSKKEALSNLREALELYFEPPVPGLMAKILKNPNSDNRTKHINL